MTSTVGIKRWKVVLGALITCALLLAAMFVYYLGIHWSQRKEVTQVVLERVGFHLHEYQKLHGRFPSSQEGLKLLYPNEGIAVVDGWGHTLVYRRNDKQERRPFSLYSSGANGLDESGSGDDLDFWKLKN